ncbi:MAG TPA: serine protease [Pyrinomonadaceae bacterium]|nr:serine protease [Pyrinomonadaceae bacterium]
MRARRLVQLYSLLFATTLVLASAHAPATRATSHPLTAATPSLVALTPSAEVLLEHVKRAVVVVRSFDERGRLQASGTGFFVRPGQLVTNLHVVGRASRVEVLTFDGRAHAVAGLVALSEARDLALLETGDACRDVATLAVEPSVARAGEEIFVVGNPQGRAWTVSRGHTLSVWESQDVGALVRISARLARGSSGSPVVNMRGRVVGVATLSLRAGEESFFAVPSDEAARLRPANLRPFPLQLAD